MKFPTDIGTSNFVFSYLAIEGLTKLGLTKYCLSPGSRSTPLALAVKYHPKAEVNTVLDERSSSFLALGLAKGSNQPIALICTSGTGPANYFPAIIEASETNIPIIALTADRPQTFRNVETNQTIDQTNLYGSYTRLFHDMGKITSYESLSDLQNTIEYLQDVLTQIQQVLIKNKGPIHINFPFSKPLEPSEPISIILETLQKYKIEIYRTTEIKKSKSELELLEFTVNSSKPLLLIGPNQFDKQLLNRIKNFGQMHKIPLIADPLSNFRQMDDTEYVLKAYDHYIDLLSNLSPDLIIKFGTNSVSSGIEKFLTKYEGNTIVFREHNYEKEIITAGETKYFNIDLFEDFKSLFEINEAHDMEWIQKLLEIEEFSRSIVHRRINQEDFEGGFVYHLLKNCGSNHFMFAANSLPIRHLSEFMIDDDMNSVVYANRGVSGIDGNISTFSGIAKVSENIGVLLIGDLASLHDLTGLFHIKRLNLKVIIIVLNNNGGGIFERLPIAKYDPPFKEYFKMEYEMNFENLALAFGLQFTSVKQYNELTEIIQNSKNSIIVEIKTNSKNHQRILEEIKYEILMNFKQSP